MDVTALVITFNEIENIDRTLARLTWASRVLIIDSGSTDETLAILGSPGDIQQRRRIEIRLRKSVSSEATASIPTSAFVVPR